MFKVSCVQFTSGKDVKENLKKVLNIIHECIKEKSDLIITPENTSIMSSDKKELLSKLNVMEDDIFLKEFKRVCRSNRKWIILGSIIVKISKDTLANRSILINPNGEIETRINRSPQIELGSGVCGSGAELSIITSANSSRTSGTLIGCRRWTTPPPRRMSGKTASWRIGPNKSPKTWPGTSGSRTCHTSADNWKTGSKPSAWSTRPPSPPSPRRSGQEATTDLSRCCRRRCPS